MTAAAYPFRCRANLGDQYNELDGYLNAYSGDAYY